MPDIELRNKNGKLVGIDESTGNEVAVRFDSVSAGALSATPITTTNPHLQNQKREWSWEDIEWEDKGEAIIDGTASGSNSPDGASYPTVINASEALDSPIDDWYCYWSGHDNPSGIDLSTAPDPWGPWTYHGEVIAGDALGGGHVASPSAAVDPGNDRLNLYVHTNAGGDQQTHLETAPLTGDGTSFTDQGVVIATPRDDSWDEQERSYFKAARIGTTWVGVYQGRDSDNNIPGIGVATSHDGVNWDVDPSPAFDNTQWVDYDPQSYLGGSPAISLVGGIPYIHYSDRGAPTAARALPLADKDRALFQPGEIVYTPPDWSAGTGVVAHDWVNHDGHLYMFHYVVTDGALDTVIGVARAELGGIFA